MSEEGEEVRDEEVGIEASQRAMAHEVGGEERQGVEGCEGDVLCKGMQVSCRQAEMEGGREARGKGKTPLQMRMAFDLGVCAARHKETVPATLRRSVLQKISLLYHPQCRLASLCLTHSSRPQSQWRRGAGRDTGSMWATGAALGGTSSR